MKKIFTLLTALLLLASCASNKTVSQTTVETTTNNGSTTTKTTTATAKKTTEQMAFLNRVADNQITAKNIVASADFRLQAGNKDLSCDGKIAMRRNEIIRLQLLLPIIRTEIARVDFTPDYVLLVDRYHKEYIKAEYKDVSFLADNGISFYSLQSLFWNELFLPGEHNLGEQQLKKLACDLAAVATSVPVSYKSGKIAYTWDVNKSTAEIQAAGIMYKSTRDGESTLHWTYDNFKQVGGKAFPLTQQFTVKTGVTGKQQTAQLSVRMSSPKTSSDWDVKTELSSKYKKIEAQDILKKLLSIQ